MPGESAAGNLMLHVIDVPTVERGRRADPEPRGLKQMM
eukprot:SAG31_NODE_40401_length_281_cov_0.571429_2_plen_37_part_01